MEKEKMKKAVSDDNFDLNHYEICNCYLFTHNTYWPTEYYQDAWALGVEDMRRELHKKTLQATLRI